jgi:hypothetical protein
LILRVEFVNFVHSTLGPKINLSMSITPAKP